MRDPHELHSSSAHTSTYNSLWQLERERANERQPQHLDSAICSTRIHYDRGACATQSSLALLVRDRVCSTIKQLYAYSICQQLSISISISICLRAQAARVRHGSCNRLAISSVGCRVCEQRKEKGNRAVESSRGHSVITDTTIQKMSPWRCCHSSRCRDWRRSPPRRRVDARRLEAVATGGRSRSHPTSSSRT